MANLSEHQRSRVATPERRKRRTVSSIDRSDVPVSKSAISLDGAVAGVEVRHLRYVIAAADQGSFYRAAMALDVEQSAISRRIRDVEDRLGVSLFMRHSDGVDLTNAGQKFINHARLALKQIDLAIKLAGSAGRGEHGIIRVGLFSSLASGFIADLLKTYESSETGVHIEYLEGAPSEHIAAIRRFRIDVAFLTGQTAPAGCETEHLWIEKVFAVLSASHPLAAKGSIG
nr:LysR family transcriptional regulator [Boseongicola sp. H5]